jgi:hypothetical protein
MIVIESIMAVMTKSLTVPEEATHEAWLLSGAEAHACITHSIRRRK